MAVSIRFKGKTEMNWQDRIAEVERRNRHYETEEDIFQKKQDAYLHWFGISEDDLKKVHYSEVYRARSTNGGKLERRLMSPPQSTPVARTTISA
jgi:hypothetical protein